jgi:RNA recognition motif-containing protein
LKAEYRIQNSKLNTEELKMNIYVGNLASETTDDELRQAFESFGQVSSIKIMRNRASGESVGFGFVGMPESEEGQAAIAGLNGKALAGSELKVEEGRAKTSFAPASTGRGGRDSGRGRGGGGDRRGGSGGSGGGGGGFGGGGSGGGRGGGGRR